MVGAGLPLVEARPLGAEFGQQLLEAASLGDEVADGPVGTPYLVPLVEVGADARGDGFLAGGHTESGWELPLADELPASVLEGPYADHRSVKFELGFLIHCIFTQQIMWSRTI